MRRLTVTLLGVILAFLLIAAIAAPTNTTRVESTELSLMAPVNTPNNNLAPRQEMREEEEREKVAQYLAGLERQRIADEAAAQAARNANVTTTTLKKVKTTTQAAPPKSAPVGGDVWSKLAACESGGDPTKHSASGKYHGAFQFSIATWRSVGGSGDPHEHSYATQLAFAQKLQAQSGWGQWPRCSRRLGLR